MAREPTDVLRESDVAGYGPPCTYASVQESREIPAKSAACVEEGKSAIDKVVYTRQDDLTAALISGDVDAMSADSPATGFAIKTSGGALMTAGEVFDTAPYGWRWPKALRWRSPCCRHWSM